MIHDDKQRADGRTQNTPWPQQSVDHVVCLKSPGPDHLSHVTGAVQTRVVMILAAILVQVLLYGSLVLCTRTLAGRIESALKGILQYHFFLFGKMIILSPVFKDGIY